MNHHYDDHDDDDDHDNTAINTDNSLIPLARQMTILSIILVSVIVVMNTFIIYVMLTIQRQQQTDADIEREQIAEIREIDGTLRQILGFFRDNFNESFLGEAYDNYARTQQIYDNLTALNEKQDMIQAALRNGSVMIQQAAATP